MLSYQVREYYEYVNKKLKKVISTKLTTKDANGVHYIIKEGGIQEQFKTLIKEFKATYQFFDVFNEYAILKRDIEK